MHTAWLSASPGQHEMLHRGAGKRICIACFWQVSSWRGQTKEQDQQHEGINFQLNCIVSSANINDLASNSTAALSIAASTHAMSANKFGKA